MPTQAPLIFSSDGLFLRSLGPKGRGPGQFLGAIDIVLLNGDSILVALSLPDVTTGLAQLGESLRAVVEAQALVPPKKY